jgi:hypothetical protein
MQAKTKRPGTGACTDRANLCEPFPEKPKRTHWQTYHQLRRRHDAAEARSTIGLTKFLDRLGRGMRWLRLS